MSRNKYLLILVLTGLISFTTATILNVPSGPYPTIQSAITAALTGDTVLVAAGGYSENVNVNKLITLQGASSATVTVNAAVPSVPVFYVTVSSVNISGFTLSGATVADQAGIFLNAGVRLCNIHDNILTGNFDGIWLGAGSNHNTFTNNTLTSNYQGFEVYSDSNIFTSNFANSNTHYGFKMESARHNTLTGNTANLNVKYGFHMVKGSGTGCDYNTFTGNTANSNTQYGLREDYGDHNTLTGNTFNLNVIDGIRLKQNITNLTLNNNNITNSLIGIDIDSSVTDVTTWTVIHNNIAGNTTYGVFNDTTGGTSLLNAENNWWGSNTGPYHSTNLTGLGNAVSDSVDFNPWRQVPVSSWAQKESLPTGVAGKYVKDGGALVAVSSNLYAFRGNKSKEFYMYNVAQNTWIAKESIPYGFKLRDTTLRIYKKKPGKGASLCWNGDSFIYATKGNNTREFWRYNINRDTWIQKAFVPSNKALKGGTSIVFKTGKVYLLAGGQKPDSNNFFVYNPAADTQRLNPINLKSPWTVLDTAPRSNDGKVYKDGSCLTVLGDSIYALKGSGKNNYFFRYNLTTPGWAMRESMPLTYVSDSSYWPLKQRKDKVRDGAAMTNDGDIIYAIKGGGRQDFMYYYPAANTWRCLDTIPKGARLNRGVPKTGAALAYIEPYVYLLKGNKTPEFWRYTASPITLFDVKPIANNVVSSVQTLDTHSSLLNAIIDITPNPFTKFATIRYTVPVSGKVSVKLYNATGRLIETLVNKYQNAGSYTLEIGNWKLEIPRGVYFLKYDSKMNNSEVKLIVQ